MLKRPFKSLIARIAIVALALSLVVPFVPAAFAQDTSIDYAENGTGPVAMFTATDEDGDDPEWSLSGDDKEDFAIDDGTLSFKKSPNYESPHDEDEDNVYEVTLNAADGSHEVTVTVTNEDEAGTVTLSDLQPQVGASVTATLKDPDGDTTRTKWQWSKSADQAEWTDIDGARSSGYTPVDDDEGMYLRAMATYYDTIGDDAETAEGMSDFTVEPTPAVNATPEFPDQEPGTPGVQDDVAELEVDEESAVGTSIGDPVAATDADNDPLLYSLDKTLPDQRDDGDDRFTIDNETGQIKVGKKLNADAGGPEDGETTAANLGFTGAVPTAVSTLLAESGSGTADSMYILKVTATDPSGAAQSIVVVVTVKQVDEAPAFAVPGTDDTFDNASSLKVTESTDSADGTSGQIQSGGNEYRATDPEGGEIAYRLEGPDAERFDLDTTTTTGSALLSFMDDDASTTPDNEQFRPDFEDPKDDNEDNKYEVTIVAVATPTTPSDAPASKVLGKKAVTVTVENGQDPGSIKLSQLQPYQGAPLTAVLNDKDGGTAGTAWQWYRGPLTDHDSDDTTPMIVNLTGTISACVDPADPVVALDAPCSIPEATSSTYTPGPADGNAVMALAVRASYFDSVTTSGTKVMADGSTDHLVRTRPTSNAVPKFVDQDPETVGVQNEAASRSVDENKANENVGDPVNAADADDANPLLYALGGPDAGSFKLESRKGGQIKTKVKLDYETKSSYMVTLTATDPLGASATIMVNISVNDGPDKTVITLTPTEPVEPEPENTAPAFDSETATLSVDENSEAGTAVGDPVVAIDPDEGEEITYSLDDDSVFEVWPNGQITVAEGANLDYESDTTSYAVTLTATDAAGESASIEITINVTNVGHSNAYDTDDSGGISKDEAVKAVQDFFAETITRGEAIAVIQLYFAG